MNSSDIFAVITGGVNIFKLNSRFTAVGAFLGAGVLLANEPQHVKNRAALGDGNGCFFKNVSVLRQKRFLFGAKITEIVEYCFTFDFDCARYGFFVVVTLEGLDVCAVVVIFAVVVFDAVAV